jgi:hypothetical protein
MSYDQQVLDDMMIDHYNEAWKIMEDVWGTEKSVQNLIIEICKSEKWNNGNDELENFGISEAHQAALAEDENKFYNLMIDRFAPSFDDID